MLFLLFAVMLLLPLLVVLTLYKNSNGSIRKNRNHYSNSYSNNSNHMALMTLMMQDSFHGNDDPSGSSYEEDIDDYEDWSDNDYDSYDCGSSDYGSDGGSSSSD